MYYLNQPNLLIRKIFYNHLDHGSPKVFSTSSNINYPLVSVLIPLYNHEKYIIECLDSIIFQNYPNLEIVLVDDASQDEGLQKAKHRLSTCNFNYIILENNLNLGICATLNRAVSKARGKYVCFIASDDLLAKGRIRKHIEVLEKSEDSSIIACHGPIQIFETNSSKIVLKKNQQKKNNYSLDSVLLKTNKINLQGCTFFKEKLIKFPFDEDLYFEDWDFLIRVFLNNYQIIYDNNISAHYRKLTNGANRNIVKMIKSRNKIREKYYDLIEKKDHQLARDFDFTISFSNLIGLSYQGSLKNWNIAFIKLLIKNPIALQKKFKDIAWSFKNLIMIRFKLERKN